jgi:hypothetical protein
MPVSRGCICLELDRNTVAIDQHHVTRTLAIDIPLKHDISEKLQKPPDRVRIAGDSTRRRG